MFSCCSCSRSKPVFAFLAAFGILVGVAFAVLAAWSFVFGVLLG